MRKVGESVSDYPEVEADWDPQNDKKPSEVHPGSKYRAKFICQLDMEVYPGFATKCLHRWEARVASRCKLQKGRKKTAGCPAHAGKEINNHDGRNALSKTHSRVAAELLNERNPERITAETITAGSNVKVWWRCSNCGYEFEAQVSSRTQGPKGRRECEVCSNRAVHPDGRNSLPNTHPFVAEDWDHERNGCVTPEEVVAGELGPQRHWHCQQLNDRMEICSHRWSQRLFSRTQLIPNGKLSGRSCPFCNPGGGFKIHRPGYFYILKLINYNGEVVARKNGITNHPKLRMKRLSLSLWRHDSDLHYELEEIHLHYDGEEVAELEKWARKQQRPPKNEFDGGDELYEENMFRKFEREVDTKMHLWVDLTEELMSELSDALERKKTVHSHGLQGQEE